MRHRLAALLVSSLAFAAVGCDSTRIHIGNPDEKTVGSDQFVETTPISDVELDALWERSQVVLGMQGYQTNAKRSRYAEREIVTHWREQLAPNRFEGSRTRAWVRFREAKPHSWVVAVAVQRQRNEDIDHPTESESAKWEDSPSEGSRSAAEVLLFKIESGFRQPGAEVEPPSPMR
jgi:hypothetical protein